jgi:DNA topoisomerase II
MIMADQDHDGSHIKGLLINFLHHFWPSLLKIDGFLKQFITPIVKCSKGKKEQTFFTIPEYITWKDDNNEGKGWKIKYYKGFYCLLLHIYLIFITASHSLHTSIHSPRPHDSFSTTGLGTSTSAEAKEYFSNLQIHEIDFMWDDKVMRRGAIMCDLILLSG